MLLLMQALLCRPAAVRRQPYLCTHCAHTASPPSDLILYCITACTVSILAAVEHTTPHLCDVCRQASHEQAPRILRRLHVAALHHGLQLRHPRPQVLQLLLQYMHARSIRQACGKQQQQQFVAAGSED